AVEMTTAHGTCAACGAVNEVGRVDVYIHAPGTVVRCPLCEQVLMRIVRGRGRYWLDLTGMRCLAFDEDYVPGLLMARESRVITQMSIHKYMGIGERQSRGWRLNKPIGCGYLPVMYG